ncbi:hypothetical protein JCM16303_001317 [Sporobolomyces ruberrimus]
MTEDLRAPVTARDRQGGNRFPALAPSGLTSPDDRTEPWDRQPHPDTQASSPPRRVEQTSQNDTEVSHGSVDNSNDSADPSNAQSHPQIPLEPPIPTLPPAIDPMPLASALPSTFSSPHLHSSSTPPPPRMRRTNRRSPNARSERAAPSSISTSDFSDLPSRLHQRRGSFSSAMPGANRASSASPPPPALETAEASGSRTRRHLDPDQHWLSEDEATGAVGGTSGARQRIAGRRRDVQRGYGSDDDAGRRKPRVDELFAQRTGRTSHEIHHRPANFPPAHEDRPSLEDSHDAEAFAAVVPRLLSLLNCPHCHEFLSNPITFGCGHTRCKDCPKIDTAASLVPEPPLVTSFPLTSTPTPHGSDLALPSKDRSNPVSSFLPGSFPNLLSEPEPSKPESSGLPSTPVPPTCGVDNCRHAEFSPLPPSFSGGPKTDYNLRKILDHLRKAISDSALVSLLDDSTMSEEKGAHDNGFEMRADEMKPTTHKEKHVARMPSDSSGSSGGGEEETKGEDDGKRAHKHKSGHTSVKVAKKSKRMSETAVEDEVLEPEALPTVPTLKSLGTKSSSLSSLALSFFADVQAECECQVCVQLLSEPITSPCGHSFCRNCLARAYDHSSKCPLCRSDLPPLPYFARERTNLALQSVLETAFPTLAAERAASIREEELAHLGNVPIFICTTAWPGIPTFLHIFEPRYRLMMRRALESPSREFGMVLPNRDGLGGVNEYGTMLRITQCNVMEDGRSIVHSVGTWRFKLVQKWMVDGYNVGRVERVEDVSLEQELELEQAALRSNNDELSEYRDPDPPGGPSTLSPMTGNMELAIDQLMQICFDFIRTLKAQSAPWVLQRLNNTVGEMPTTPAEFTWWCGEVMPVEDHVKVALLSITSVRERLRLIVFWIDQFRSSWWYSRGCSIM